MAITGILLSNAEVQKNLKDLFKTSNKIMFENRPIVGMIKKIDDLEGKTISYLSDIAKAGGLSADFDTAYAERTNPGSRVKWTITTTSASNSGGIAEDNAQIEINEKTLRFANGDMSSFYEEFSADLVSMKKRMGERLNFFLYRNAHGGVGQVTYTATQTTFTLQDPYNHPIFEIGDALQFAANSSGVPGTIRASSAKVYIIAINRESGVITCAASRGGSAAAVDTTITGLTTGDWVFPAGNLNAAVAGLQDWIKGSTVSSTSHFGVDRTADPTKLAGHVITGTASIVNSLIDAAEKVEVYGSKDPTIFMNPADVKTLKKELENKTVYYKDIPSSIEGANISYKAMQFEGLTVVSDLHVPKSKAFVLALDTLELHTNGELASGLRIDEGRESVVDITSDGKLVRLKSYFQLVCKDPSKNVIVNLP
jgi:hypothetical protein